MKKRFLSFPVAALLFAAPLGAQAATSANPFAPTSAQNPLLCITRRLTPADSVQSVALHLHCSDGDEAGIPRNIDLEYGANGSLKLLTVVIDEGSEAYGFLVKVDPQDTSKFVGARVDSKKIKADMAAGDSVGDSLPGATILSPAEIEKGKALAKWLYDHRPPRRDAH